MAIFLSISTNATKEEIEEALESYYTNITQSVTDNSLFNVYIEDYVGNYLKPSDVKNVFKSNLKYIFKQKKEELKYEILGEQEE